MQGWNTIRFTQTDQVMERMEQSVPDGANQNISDYYKSLKDAGQMPEALSFLGHALPNIEAAGWAAHYVHSQSFHHKILPQDKLALDCAVRWMGEPCEEYRRAAQSAADGATDNSPEEALGLAIFMSGGSISTPNFASVLPPPMLCNRFAVSAILSAIYRNKKPADHFIIALTLGETIAERGLEALPAL
jgi:hypothetical protein